MNGDQTCDPLRGEVESQPKVGRFERTHRASGLLTCWSDLEPAAHHLDTLPLASLLVVQQSLDGRYLEGGHA